MIWEPRTYPPCAYHAFLSHSSEDKQWLVEPVEARLKSRSIIPWYDRRNFPLAANPFGALRDGILLSRCTVYFLTLATMNSARGWQVAEKVYAGLLQDSLNYGGKELCRIELPLFFLPRNDANVARSVWQPLVGRGLWHSPPDGDEANWATEMITRFLADQVTLAQQMNHNLAQDPTLLAHVDAKSGMLERIVAAHP